MKPFELHPAIMALANAASAGVRPKPADLRLAREALVEERLRFRTLFDFAPDGYLVTDSHGTIRDANLMASALFGVGRSYLVRKPLTVFVRLADRPRLRTLLNQLAAGDGRPRTFEAVLQPRGASPFDAEIRVAGTLELRWMVRDVTRQRAAERALAREVEERSRAEERARGSEERYRQLSGHLQRRIEDERTRIAREVHDELGAALTAIRFELSLGARDMAGPGASREAHMAAILRVDETIRAMQRICGDLRPSLLDHLGLWAAIEWLAEDFSERTGIRCTVDLDRQAEVRDPDRATALFRIVQEALTNALRHAQPKEISIVARESRGELRIEVTDDGRGIGEAEIARPNAFGLIGMQERALACGGEVTFERPGRGTRVVVRLQRSERQCES